MENDVTMNAAIVAIKLVTAKLRISRASRNILAQRISSGATIKIATSQTKPVKALIQKVDAEGFSNEWNIFKI